MKYNLEYIKNVNYTFDKYKITFLLNDNIYNFELSKELVHDSLKNGIELFLEIAYMLENNIKSKVVKIEPLFEYILTLDEKNDIKLEKLLTEGEHYNLVN